MTHWWRSYDGAVDHPKLLLLSDRLFRIWFNVMCINSANEGRLPKLEVVAVKLRTSSAKAYRALGELCDAGLLDKAGDYYGVHNWDDRQFKSDVSTERVKRFRNAKRNVSETPPDNRVQNTERKREPDAGASASELERELFQRGRQVLGQEAGGLIANLLKSKEGDVALARAAIETASTKDKPREYVGGILKGNGNGTYRQGRGQGSAITAAIDQHIANFERTAEDEREVCEASPRLLPSGGRE